MFVMISNVGGFFGSSLELVNSLSFMCFPFLRRRDALIFYCSFVGHRFSISMYVKCGMSSTMEQCVSTDMPVSLVQNGHAMKRVVTQFTIEFNQFTNETN